MPAPAGPGAHVPTDVPGYDVSPSLLGSPLHDAVRRADGTPCRVLLLPRDAADAVADAEPALRRLDHPGLLPVLDVVLAPTAVALVVRSTAGGPLRAHLDALPSLAPGTACGLVAGLLDAIAAAHAAGASPTGLSARDVLVVPGAAGPRLVVVPGPPADPQADVTAAAALLHELLVGAAPGGPLDTRLPAELAAVLSGAAQWPAARVAAALSALVPRLHGLPPLALLPEAPRLLPPAAPEPPAPVPPAAVAPPASSAPPTAPRPAAPPVPAVAAQPEPAPNAPLDPPADVPEPAPVGAASGRILRRRALAATAVASVVVAGGLAAAAVSASPDEPPQAAPVAVADVEPVVMTLPVEPLPGGAVLSRTWELGQDRWHRLTAVLVVANPGTSRLKGTAVDVVPAPIARRATDLDHGRAPSSWADGDPVVVRWSYDVPPGGTQRWRWGVDVAPSLDAPSATALLDGYVGARAAAARRVVPQRTAAPSPTASPTRSAPPSPRASATAAPSRAPSPAPSPPAPSRPPRPVTTRSAAAPAPAVGTVVLVDDHSASTSGTWVTVSGGVGGTYQEARRQGCSDRGTALRWAARLAPGRWDVAVHLTGRGAAAARYVVGTRGGDVVAVLDQRDRGWTSLVVDEPLTQGAVRLVASGCGDREAVGDAVRFTYRGR